MSKLFLCKCFGTNLGKCEWVWEELLRWLNPRWQNSRWQNSRWLPSSSWVRMNEFESDWISLSQSQSGERECFGVNLRKENKVSESKMSEYKKATIIKLSQNEWVKFFFTKWLNQRWQISRWQYLGWLPSSSWMRINEFESDWISLSHSQNGVRLFLSESQRRKQGVWIQDGKIQDTCHHQVESEWMSEVFFVQMVGTNLGKCELVWEELLRWQNPRW